MPKFIVKLDEGDPISVEAFQVLVSDHWVTFDSGQQGMAYETVAVFPAARVVSVTREG